MKLITLTLTAGLLFSSIANAEFAGEWNQQQVLEKHQKDNVMIVDVRSKEEFAAGHVPGAINIPHTEIAQNMDKLADHKQSKIVLYCKSGRRAGIAENYLSSHGFTQLYHLKGDMNGWYGAGLKVSK